MENRNQNSTPSVNEMIERLQPQTNWVSQTDRALDRLHALQGQRRDRRRRNLVLAAGCCTVGLVFSVFTQSRSAAERMLNRIFIWQAEGRFDTAPDFALENIAGGSSRAT